MEGHKINTAPEFVLTDNLKAHRGLIMSEVPERRRFRNGQQLSRGGTPSPQVYFILEGAARASVVNVYGYERTLGYLRQNTICCMDALRHDAGVSVTITALTTLRAVPLTLADMSRLMGLSSAFAEDVMVYYSDILKLMCLDAESQSSNSVLNKLANFIGLYVLSEDYARFGFLPFSQQELASAIGASRVQVARVCEKLKAQGIVDIKKRRLYVLDRAALAEMASLEVSS